MPPSPTTVILVVLCCLVGALHANQIDEALTEIPAYSDAITALTQNKNAVASIGLQKVAAMDLPKPERIRVLCRLAEAEVRRKEFGAALELFEEPGLALDPEATYWQAIALLGAKRAGEAEKVLAGITKQPDHPQWPEAILTRTSLLLRFGAPEEAIKILSPLIDSEREPHASRARLRAAEIRLSQEQWDEVASLLDGFQPPESLPVSELDYLRARLSLGRGNWSAALSQLETLNSPETLATLPPNMRDGSIISLAAALRESGEAEAAATLLNSFIDSNPQSPNLGIAFDTLDEIIPFASTQIDERLVNWANSPSPMLAGFATYFLALAQTTAVSQDAAAATLETVRSTFPDHPIAERALLQLSEIYVSDGNKSKALAVLTELRDIDPSPAVLARIDFIEARADYAAGEFKKAADKLADTALAGSEAAAAATFNSAIASLKAGDLEAFKQRAQRLDELGEPEVAGSLQLERALFSARQEDPQASGQLAAFLTDFPTHPRRAEAHLALAYLQLTTVEKPKSARSHVEEARKSPLSPSLEEEADYVSFWIDIGAYDNPAAIASGEKFVKNHPGSARAPEILFKLAGIYFRDGSFSAAQTHFERLAIDYPSSPRAEIALFSAGRAAMRTGTTASIESAVDIFNRVAQLGGQFATAARLQQAIVRRTQLGEEQAIPILEGILKEKPSGELLFSTLITKGESLSIIGGDDPEKLEAPIAVFESVAKNPEVTTFWLNQSLTRMGNCLERAGRTDEALSAYEKVIQRPRPTLAEGETPEYFWFYKAGFAAIRIYEERKNWEAAIHTADILAATEGPGAQAARERSEQLETKNFIWRD